MIYIWQRLGRTVGCIRIKGSTTVIISGIVDTAEHTRQA